MQELLYAVSRYNKQEPPIWVIWGSGNRGREVLKFIQKLNPETIYFADNDRCKQGTRIEGIVCLSRKEVEEIADRCIIIASPYRDSDLSRDLYMHFPYVIPDLVLEVLWYYPKANGFDGFVPLGHYYSLYPDMAEIEKKRDELYRVDKVINSIDFNMECQYGFLEEMKVMLPSAPKWPDKSHHDSSIYRYQTDATAFCLPDALYLHFMLRILKPKRLIEVGSGWSSAVSLDTNEFYMNNEMKISFIEPYPETLHQIMKEKDNYEIKECGLENVDLAYFEKLEKGDILFIDSTHVSKMGSDVNYLLFEILPRLKKGVYIHFHDIFFPFEYPYHWINKEGWIWNELYLLRAFLMNNKEYRMVFFVDYLAKMHTAKVKECLKMANIDGGSFWIEKV